MPGLIAHPGQLWLMAEPVDMRRGINGLSMMVQQILKRSPCGGYPAENWQLIRTTNPIESVFATVRLRTAKMKNCGSRTTTLTMAFKLMETAQKKWFRLKGYSLLADVINGVSSLAALNKQQIKNRMPLDSLYTRFDYNSMPSFVVGVHSINYVG